MVTNGGEPLIEDGALMLSHGRRYGLIGRNGAAPKRAFGRGGGPRSRVARRQSPTYRRSLL